VCGRYCELVCAASVSGGRLPWNLHAHLQFAVELPIWKPGGWWWTVHSPTGSGPEGSSPNEPGTGHCSSLPPFFAIFAFMTACSLTVSGRAGETGFADGRFRSRSPDAGLEQCRSMNDAGTSDADTSAAGQAPAPYRVLARKYRPSDFSQLIGQEPMVRTLTNAFSSGRIAQAWMLTGVRGVGKTTTARILARALNYKTATVDRPSVDLVEIGEHCRAIMEGRHVDVIEMDAASHTGIDDIRDIIDRVRYAPVSARYKVYIIDEVHMLSTTAFTGLMTTLEEPPPHV